MSQFLFAFFFLSPFPQYEGSSMIGETLVTQLLLYTVPKSGPGTQQFIKYA